MPRPLKRGILGASTIILSKDIDKYAFMCGSNFYESDLTVNNRERSSKTLISLTSFIVNNKYKKLLVYLATIYFSEYMAE